MQKDKVVFKFSNKSQEFAFENKVFVLENKALCNELKLTNIKNRDSSLLIQSENGIIISDVIQIKVNLMDTGYLLVNFAKDYLDEEKRTTLLKQIGELKNDAVPSVEIQTEKILSLIQILNKYEPLYVCFVVSGIIRIEASSLLEEKVNYPLLVLPRSSKKIFLNIDKVKSVCRKALGKIKNKFFKKEKTEEKSEVEKKPKPDAEKKAKPEKKAKEKVSYPPISLFEVDYLFVFIFSLLGTFGITTCIAEIMNKEGIAVFLGILGFAFAIVLVISMQATIYRHGKELNPYLRYYLAIFIVLGIVAGIITGYFISKGVLKIIIPEENYKKIILLSSLISCATSLSSIGTSILANKIILKFKKK